MRDLKVLEERREGYESRYSQLLYTGTNFLNANNNLPQIHYYLVEKMGNYCFGHVGFSLEEGKVFSPYKAPFGGFSLNEHLSSQEITFFVFEVLRKLKQHSIETIQLKLMPQCYLLKANLLAENLVYLGFEQTNKELYQAIEVGGQAFDTVIAATEKRRLKKCLKAGFEVKQLSHSQLLRVFGFVKEQRAAKGYDFSMNWTQLKQAQKAEPSAYIPFAVFDEDKMIAATVAIRSSDTVLYNFSPAHHPDYDAFSPSVLLTQGLYNFCQQQGFGYIDLGTSYINGKENSSLKNFKKHLGGKDFYSLSYRKTLTLH